MLGMLGTLWMLKRCYILCPWTAISKAVKENVSVLELLSLPHLQNVSQFKCSSHKLKSGWLLTSCLCILCPLLQPCMNICAHCWVAPVWCLHLCSVYACVCVVCILKGSRICHPKMCLFGACGLFWAEGNQDQQTLEKLFTSPLTA